MQKRKIVVFGSYITDLTARVTHFPKAGETVFGSSFRYGPGGKGSNQAVAAKRAGADVVFITRVGKDFFGQYAEEFYASERMDFSHFIVDPENATGAALIMVDENSSQNEIVVIPGACTHFSSEELAGLDTVLDEAAVLVTQLETNMDAVEWMMAAAHRKGVLTLLNPAPAMELSDELLSNTDIIVPNETEATLISGLALDADCGNAAAVAERLRGRGVSRVIITLGKNGFFATDGKRELLELATDYYPVVDTTGAGDAFIGSFSAALAKGFDFFEAARYANVASSIAVSRMGTAPAMAMEEEILRIYQRKIQ